MTEPQHIVEPRLAKAIDLLLASVQSWRGRWPASRPAYEHAPVIEQIAHILKDMMARIEALEKETGK